MCTEPESCYISIAKFRKVDFGLNEYIKIVEAARVPQQIFHIK